MFIQSFNFFVSHNVFYLVIWNFEREVVDRLGDRSHLVQRLLHPSPI